MSTGVKREGLHNNGMGGYVRVNKEGKEEKSTVRIRMDHHPVLRYSDSELACLLAPTMPDILAIIPGLRYWELGDIRKMDRPDNKTGCQERAFEYFWTVYYGQQRGKIFLGAGTSTVIPPATLGTDKWCGESPHPDRYPSRGYPHMYLDLNSPFPFYDNQFAGVAASHVFEHVDDIKYTIRESLRVTELGGYVCILMPDVAFSARGSIDPTHTREFTSDEFLSFLEEARTDLPPFEIVEHNTLDNMFSFNTVIRKA